MNTVKKANILAMISFEQKTSTDIVVEVAQRVRARRKELGLTQVQLAQKAGMTFASYKRFEQKGLVSFQSLAAIAIALRCEEDFDALFARKAYKSIDDVIAEKRRSKR